jgi:hypothetical protein
MTPVTNSWNDPLLQQLHEASNSGNTKNGHVDANNASSVVLVVVVVAVVATAVAAGSGTTVLLRDSILAVVLAGKRTLNSIVEIVEGVAEGGVLGGRGDVDGATNLVQRGEAGTGRGG